MKKLVITSILMFSFGFLTHAFFFPDFLANGLTDVKQIALPNPSPSPQAAPQSDFETKITFDGKHFSRHNIVVDVGNYLSIMNTSKGTLMWLTSNDPLLATSRGYGESEQVRERMETLGQFVVADKNNPSERLVITVK